jgi:hypothetical protein
MSDLGVIKHLDIEPSLLNFNGVLDYIDNTEFSKVKTKYSKGDDWTAISLRGYGPDPLDILKPNVLKSGVNEQAKLQDTSLINEMGFQVINDVLAKIPSTFERVRLMKIKANSGIGKHSDKIDKDFGLEDGKIVRIHVPIRTNDQVEFYLWESREKLTNYLEVGHYYYVDVRAPHAVTNNSDVDRIHLVVDTYVNSDILGLLGIKTFW